MNIRANSAAIATVALFAAVALIATASIRPHQASAQSIQLSLESINAFHNAAAINPAIIGASTDAAIYPDAAKLQAKHVLVSNLTTGQVLFDKDSLAIQPLASLAKLMTAITAKEIAKSWAKPPQRIKLVAKSGAYTAADREVAAGGYMKYDDLISYMLLSSSNFAAQSLANNIMPYSSFMSYVNFTAKKLGLANSRFINASGLTNDDGTLSTGNAVDVMKTLGIIVTKYPELATATRSEDAVIKTSTGKLINIDNTNKSLEKIKGIFLGKTGYTDEAGGNLAIVLELNGSYYGIVVLGSTLEGRFSDVEYLASLIPANR